MAQELLRGLGAMTGPHDRLFRYVFNPPARAEALLRYNLPVQLSAQVDWSTLRRESGTLVHAERETRQDLLFSARCRSSSEHEPPHYFLIEHQSSVERWMAVRLHDYAWRLLTHWRELNPKSRWIPEITALVVYPRKDRHWSAPLRLEDHYRGQHSPVAIRFAYQVDDLSTQSEQAVRSRPGPPLVPLGLLVLTFAGTEQLALNLPHWRELFSQVQAGPNGPQTIYRLVRYLHQLGDEAAVEALRRVLHSIMQSPRAEALMKTMEQVLRERGHEEALAKGLAKGRTEGRTEGRAEGKAEGLAKALLLLLDSKGLPMDDASRQRIQSCTDVAILERWLDRVLHATHLSQVLDGPAQ